MDVLQSSDFGSMFGHVAMLYSGQTIYFDDKNFNVKGYILTRPFHKRITNAGEQTTIAVDVSQIHVYANNNMNAVDYVNKMRKRINEDEVDSPQITLKYVKVIPKTRSDPTAVDMSNHILIMYEGLKTTVNERKERLMKTFFHPKKNYLLTFMDKITNDPDYFTSRGQPAQLNMILHGPPGTGKSSFVYRLAMAYNRHIISVDLSTVTTKSSAYQIIQTPEDGYSKFTDPKSYIILLEEFDIAVNTLKKKKRNANSDDAKTDVLMSLLTGGDDSDVGKKDTSNNKKDTGSGSGSGSGMTHFLSSSREDFYLEDLLEIFQGPVPRPGQIIIATTNKFNEIYEDCPALFRPGRLTPVEFDYLKRDEINELIKQYLGDDGPQIDFDPIISTAKIIEILQHAEITGETDDVVDTLREIDGKTNI